MFVEGGERWPDLRPWGVAAASCSVSLGLLQHHGLLAFAPVLVVAQAFVLIGIGSVCARWPLIARWPLLLGWLAAGALLWLFRARYPEWNVRVDRDEALDLAVRELLAGRPPYRAVTQLGNPVSPLPGSLLMALPFVLLGSSAYQNWGWGALALGSVARRWGSSAALLALVASFGSLALTQEWLFGGDLITVAVASAGAALAVVAAVDRPRLRAWAGLALGIALLSRPNLAFVFVSLLAWALRTRRARVVLPMLASAALVYAALLAAFYLWDPLHFTPFHVIHKLDQPSHGNLAGAVSAMMLLAAALLGASPWYRGPESARLFLELSVVQAVPLVTMVIGQSIGETHATFSFLKERYGIVPFVWCVVAWLFTRDARAAKAAQAREGVHGAEGRSARAEPG